jgi:leucyl aminopeptidase
MRARSEIDLKLEPRFVVSLLEPGPLANVAATAPGVADSAGEKQRPWKLVCHTLSSLENHADGPYGKWQAGQVYVVNPAERLAYIVLAKTGVMALDNTRPGRRHVSFFLGNLVYDLLQAKKELLQAAAVTIDLSHILEPDWLAHLDEFACALLVRSARGSFARPKNKTDNEIVQVKLTSSDETKTLDDSLLSAAAKLADAMLWTRSLIHAPPNLLRPDAYERIVLEMCKALREPQVGMPHSIDVEVFKGASLAELNCRLIEAVGQGSSVEPRLIKVTYRPRAASAATQATRKKVALIGKGITFDSGGYDIKGSAFMRNMKKDMGGSAAVLGILHAVVQLGLDIELDCYLCLAENMVSGNAFRPGDVISARDGSLVEIDNTDAEGRLVLADALHLAAESNPDWIIDLATLTGAARVALGPDVDSMFSNEADKALLMASCGVETGDWVWQLPRVASYQKMLESGIADMANSSSSGHGGAITAALFLEKFVGRTAWTHIDTYMWTDKPGSMTTAEVGATAKCVRLVVQVLKRFCETQEQAGLG